MGVIPKASFCICEFVPDIRCSDLWHNLLDKMGQIILPRDPESRVAQSFRTFSSLTAIVTILIASVVLAGWITGIQILKTFIPNSPSVKVNAAIAFICLGFGLLFMQERKNLVVRNRTAAKGLAMIVGLIGAISLAEYLFHWNAGVDQILFQETSTGTTSPGRIAPHAAFTFVLLAIAIVSLDIETQMGRRVSQILAFTSALIAWIALIGYVYGERAFYSISSYTAFAPHGAIAALLISLGAITARPTKGIMRVVISEQEGGAALRRLLPFLFSLFPFWGGFGLPENAPDFLIPTWE